MGSADRQYMRGRDGPGLIEPAARRSPLTWIVGACVLGFLVIGAAAGWGRTDLASPAVFSLGALREGRWWTPVTALLVERGAWSLLFSMLALWFFGRMVEDWTGSRGFCAFLALAHLAGLAVHAAADASGSPRGMTFPVAGTSGIALACLVFAAFREPRRTVMLWFLPVPIWALAAVYTTVCALGALRIAGDVQPNLWMQLGGAAYGAAAHRFGVTLGFVRPRPRAAQAPGPTRAGPAAPSRTKPVQDRVDALLEKIAATGMSSLTDEERAFLRDASKDYGRR